MSAQASHRRGGRLLAVCLTTAIAAMCLGVGVARANRLITITFPDRHGEIPSKWLTYPGACRGRMCCCPTGYTRRKRYPLIVLLPGFSNTYAILGPGMLDAQTLLPDLQAIVVSPEGEDRARTPTGTTTVPTARLTGRATSWMRRSPRSSSVTRSSRSAVTTPCSGSRWGDSAPRTSAAGFPVSSARSASCPASSTRSIYPAGTSPTIDALAGAPPGSVFGPEDGFYATGHNPSRSYGTSSTRACS